MGEMKPPARELTPREMKVLHFAIHRYIESAEPVGSRSIAKAFGFNMSAATVRNICADLEETGFLHQPHTSAGRVPTDLGYRYYIDELVKAQELTRRERERLEKEYSERRMQMDDILQKTAYLLSAVSGQTAVVVYPDVAAAEIRHVSLTRLGENQMMLILVTRSGLVQNRAVQVSGELSDVMLDRMISLLNRRLVGTQVSDVQQNMAAAMEEFRAESDRLASAVRDVIAQGLQTLMTAPPRVRIEGRNRMLEQPDFSDIDKLHDAMKIFESEEELGRLFRPGMDDVEIQVGHELARKEMDDLSLVRAPYDVRGRMQGSFGLIGPRRMPYDRVIGLMRAMRGVVNSVFSRLGGRE